MARIRDARVAPTHGPPRPPTDVGFSRARSVPGEPAVALLGASAVLLCDIIGRSIRYPFEVPVATIFGVVGTVLFLWLLLRAPAEQ